MTHALTKTPDHLADNRTMILGRSIAASSAGAIPLPLVDDWLASSIRRGLFTKLAEARSVDIDQAGIAILADGKNPPPTWSKLMSGSFLLRLVAKQWRKLLIAVVAAKRIQAASRIFSIATCFDHYCAKMHVGLGIDQTRGTLLRSTIDQAIKKTPGGLSRHLFRRGIESATTRAGKLPKSLMTLSTPAWVESILSKSDEAQAAHEVEEVIAQDLTNEDGLLAKVSSAIDQQFGLAENAYLEQLIMNFESLWSEKHK